MRHRVAGRKLNRTMEHRRALMRNMVTSLIVEERIETTLPRAKELRRVADRMITLGKRGTLHAQRQALAFVRTGDAVRKLFTQLAPRFAERKGGYTRILKVGVRHGDSAPLAIIEYLDAPLKLSKEERKKARKEAQKEAAQKEKAAKPKKKAEKKAKKSAKPKDKSEEPEAKPAKKTAIKTEVSKKPEKLAKQKKRGVFSRVLRRKADRGGKK